MYELQQPLTHLAGIPRSKLAEPNHTYRHNLAMFFFPNRRPCALGMSFQNQPGIATADGNSTFF